jgi:phosphoribosylformimino-5-aminoimidazole carboxamide ribonucleotide (ProFAR) isomerase
MGFEVIPAIDVTGGRLGRLTADGPVAVEAFGGDPVTAAEAFMRAGARRLHVVDMDLAFTGAALNIEVVMAVRRAALFRGATIQASGGVVTSDDLEHLLDVGVDRVVLGSAALADPAFVTAAVERHGERIAVGIEVVDGVVRARGRSAVELPLDETLAWLAGTAVTRFIVTAVARVGELSGPDLGAVVRVAASGRPVLAAGGIASLQDLRDVRGTGAEGAIVGRAALEEGFDLASALTLGAE